jgi:predicted GIY-YIG superfamily endonuclease
MDKNHYCYILRNKEHIKRTYNGYTVSPKHRIRQHNQEIKGGAKYTTKWGNKTWEIYVLIKGFPDHHNALQCEWKIKHPARKRVRPSIYNSTIGRVIGLNEVLHLDKWTSNSTYLTKDINLEIWILNEYESLLIDIPDNIKINVVEQIDLDNI